MREGPDLSANLQAVNDLRKAMYSFELKSVSNLQFINGGGATVLVGFLTHVNNPSIFSRWLFLGAVASFMLGLLLSLILSYVSPVFLSARYQQNENRLAEKNYNAISRKRFLLLTSSTCFFFLAIILAAVAWLKI